MKLAAFIFLVAMIGACGGEAKPATPSVTAAPSSMIQSTVAPTLDVAATVTAAVTMTIPVNTPPPSIASPRPTATTESTAHPSSPLPTASPRPAVMPEPTAHPSPVEGSLTDVILLKLVEPSTARYIIREQLARLDLPNDAIGQTSDVSGMIRFDASGEILQDSVFTVNVSSLTSDEARRDRYLKSRALESDQYPTVKFAINEVKGLPWPLPTSGAHTFDLIGDLTIKEVTKPVIWRTVVEFASDKIVGNASVTITFEEFDMRKPRFAFIISVAEEFKLELNFSGRVLTTTQ